MRYAIADPQLEPLEARCRDSADATALDATLQLAWHLRQRDSARALRLLAPHWSALHAAGWQPLARARLVACEVETLFGHLAEAERQLADVQLALASHRDPVLEGDALLAEASLAKAQGDSPREVRALAGAGHHYVRAGDFQRLGVAQGLLAGERVASRTSAPQPEPGVPVDSGDDAVRALQMAADGLALWLRDPQQVAQILPRAALLASRMGLIRLACVCTFNAGNAWRVVGELGQAAVQLDRALRLALSTGWPSLIATTQSQVGALLRQIGRPDEAQRLLDAALKLQRGLPAGPARANACSELAQTLIDLKRGPEAAAVMDEAVALYRGLNARLNLPAALLRLARALSLTGREAQAQDCIEEAQQLIAEHGYAALGVDVFLALADAHRRGRLPPPPDMEAANPTLHFAQAALAAGRRIRGWRPPESLLVCLSDAWADAGDHRRALDHARQALDEKTRVVDQLLGQASTVAGLLALAGGPAVCEVARTPVAVTVHATSGESDGLTPREREILSLLARGYSNKDIATALDLSGDTVKWHLKNLFAKLGANSRRHVVLRARTLGILGAVEEGSRVAP
jgi:ATP/maltotriose-dependent transcriptional regulator MalT